MDWNYKNFREMAAAYFTDRGWTFLTGEKDSLVKGYQQEFCVRQKMENLVNDNCFFKKIVPLFQELQIEDRTVSRMKNENHDTDLVIAGFQMASFLLGKEELKKESWYSFQPVIRQKHLKECGKQEGCISSFVNICLIDVDTSVEEYLVHTDWWITVLSRLSLHVSGLCLILKKHTTAFGGFGIEFQYKGIEIGQANIYRAGNGQPAKYISDFGFGYERLLWVVNGGRNFYYPFFNKYDIEEGSLEACDKMRTAVLLIMGGILPSSAGAGKHVRRLIRLSKECQDRFYEARILRYYQYYSKFICPLLNYEQTVKVYIREADGQQMKELCYKNMIRPPQNIKKDFLTEYEKLFFLKRQFKNNLGREKL